MTMKAYMRDGARLKATDFSTNPEVSIWVDLLSPTPDEKDVVEKWFGITVPTREDMEEIEISSRLYSEEGVFFMTGVLPAHSETERPEMAPVTFVLAGDRLITVRHHEPRAFQTFPLRAEKLDVECRDGRAILVALLETIVDRLADLLEQASSGVLQISSDIFRPAKGNATQRGKDFQELLHRIGRKEDFVSKLQGSLLTLQRLVGYLGEIALPPKSDPEARGRLKTVGRDLRSLSDHANSLSQKITFLLDATLGMINIEQSDIIRIVSVAAAVFLPPTLIASIYGMNFVEMPELKWFYGYVFAIGLMIVVTAVPLWFFRRRGWL